MSREQIIIDLINRQFDDVHRQLAVIVAGNEQRNLDMNAKHKSNSDRLDALENKVTFFKGAVWIIGLIGTAIGAIVGFIPTLWQMFHKAS